MYLRGFGFGGYRSFKTPQLFWPLSQINLIIGQNNTGKSNVLNFVSRHLQRVLDATRQNRGLQFEDHLDMPRDSDGRTLHFLIAREQVIGPHEDLRRRLPIEAIAIVERILRSPTLSRNTNLSWFEYAGEPRSRLVFSPQWIQEVCNDRSVANQDWHQVWHCIRGASGGSMKDHWVPETLATLTPTTLQCPEVVAVPAFRNIAQGEYKELNWSGIGLIEHLAKLQNPLPHEYSHRERFDRLVELLRRVTGNDQAQLEVPYDRSGLNIYMDGRVLPLASLGTGIHEVIILGAAATIHERKIVCIEEPELHLHPTLQRKLLSHIKEQTQNQYFIATHSAHLIDTPDASVFHVRLENGYSAVGSARSPNEKSEVCSDLGYRPSDLMQANCVIWVEGPTDRLYIRQWITSLDGSLIEGLHYSIMFYGGRLLSHLSADDSEVSDFISLRRLNRRGVIVIDSDKRSSKTQINATKGRVSSEFASGPGFAWITAGREIENYWRPSSILSAIRRLDTDAHELQGSNRFSAIWKYKSNDGHAHEVDKIKLAHVLLAEPIDLDVLDLREKIERLVAFVRASNHAGS